MNKELYNEVKTQLEEHASVRANYKIAPYLKTLFANNQKVELYKTIYRALYDVSKSSGIGYLDWARDKFNKLYGAKISANLISEIVYDDFELESILLMGKPEVFSDSVLNMIYTELENRKKMGSAIPTDIELELESRLNIVKEPVIQEKHEEIPDVIAPTNNEEQKSRISNKIMIVSNMVGISDMSLTNSTLKRTDMAVAKTASLTTPILNKIASALKPNYKDEEQKIEKQSITV